MKRPIESDYISQVAYTRALEAYCDRQERIKRAEEAFEASQFNPDWSMLEAVRESLREHMSRIKELEAKLAQQEQIIQSYLEKDNSQQEQSVSVGEPVTLLPDGSAFGVISFPLPDDHWIYAPNEYRDGEYEPIDLPKPILTLASRDEVVAAVRYAVRGATMRGQETDFDPDALVQNAVYALCGPFTSAQPAPKQEQAKQEQGEPVAWMYDCGNGGRMYAEDLDASVGWIPLYTTPQQRTWTGLTSQETDIEAAKEEQAHGFILGALWAEAKLKEKNT
jgi:hypothetical protein